MTIQTYQSPTTSKLAEYPLSTTEAEPLLASATFNAPQQRSKDSNQLGTISPNQLILALHSKLEAALPDLKQHISFQSHSFFDEQIENISEKLGLSQEVIMSLKDNLASNLINGFFKLARFTKVPAIASQVFGKYYIESYDLNFDNGIGPILRVNLFTNNFGIFAVELKPLNYHLDKDDFLVFLKKTLTEEILSIFNVQYKYHSPSDLIESGVGSDIISTAPKGLSSNDDVVMKCLEAQQLAHDTQLYNFLRDYFSQSQGRSLLELTKRVPSVRFDYIIAHSRVDRSPFLLSNKERQITLSIKNGFPCFLDSVRKISLTGERQDLYTVKTVDFMSYALLHTSTLLYQTRRMGSNSIFNSGVEQRLRVASVESWLKNLSTEVAKKIQGKK